MGQTRGPLRSRPGFTLIELMIVVIIIVIMAGMSVALLSTFFRGQGARQGAAILSQAAALCKQEAASRHRVTYLVFSAVGQDAWVEIHDDTTWSGQYQADASHPLVGERILLPKFATFDRSPDWIGFYPSGYLKFSAGSPPMPASGFDRVMNGPAPVPIGDVVIGLQNQPFKMCLNFDRASGKVRRSFFLNPAP